jgi:hypothetical protein
MKTKKREVIEINSIFKLSNGEYKAAKISAYKIKRGLAIGHPINMADIDSLKYAPKWVIYHVATGAIAWGNSPLSPDYKTPLEAMRSLRAKHHGKFYKLCDDSASKFAPATDTGEPIDIIGKLKPWPKARAPEGLPASITLAKHSQLIKLIGEINTAISSASKDSKFFCVFYIGATCYRVRNNFNNLARFKAATIKNRAALSDDNLQPMAAQAWHIDTGRDTPPPISYKEIKEADNTPYGANFARLARINSVMAATNTKRSTSPFAVVVPNAAIIPTPMAVVVAAPVQVQPAHKIARQAVTGEIKPLSGIDKVFNAFDLQIERQAKKLLKQGAI